MVQQLEGQRSDASPPRVTRPEGSARMRASAGERALNAFSHSFLLVWALLVTLPLMWAAVSAFKSNRGIFGNPWGLPARWHWENFTRAWTEANIGRYFLNSSIVVGGALVLVMLLGAMTAYVLARYDFVGRRPIYYLFISGMMFPIFLALVPLFFVVQNLGMLGTYRGLILTYTAYALPFTVFFLTAFFRTLPTPIAEAAFIDGCSHTRAFFRIMLPMAKPGLISVGIFNFLGLWNQYLLPLVLNPEPNMYVLSQGLAALAVSQGYGGEWGVLFAGLVVATLPVLVVYAVFQRRIQSGLSVGALK